MNDIENNYKTNICHEQLIQNYEAEVTYDIWPYFI